MSEVEKLIEKYNNLWEYHGMGSAISFSKVVSDLEKIKEKEKEQIAYTESDMRSYASYILNNPVIEPSQWHKIYRTKSE